MVMSLAIIGVGLWSTREARKSLHKYQALYKQSGTRHLWMIIWLLLHFALKNLTAVLFLSNKLLLVKCAGYKNPNDIFYVGYLGVYHVLNEYIPCLAIILMLIFHESTSVTGASTVQRQNVADTIERIQRESRSSQRGSRARPDDKNGLKEELI